MKKIPFIERNTMSGISEEAQTLDLLDEDFKLTTWKMLKELKETMKKEIEGSQENDVWKSRKYQ